MIDEEFVRDIKRLYEEVYGEPISYAEAEQEAFHLLTLYRILCRPLPSEVKKRQEERAASAEDEQAL